MVESLWGQITQLQQQRWSLWEGSTSKGYLRWNPGSNEAWEELCYWLQGQVYCRREAIIPHQWHLRASSEILWILLTSVAHVGRKKPKNILWGLCVSCLLRTLSFVVWRFVVRVPSRKVSWHHWSPFPGHPWNSDLALAWAQESGFLGGLPWTGYVTHGLKQLCQSGALSWLTSATGKIRDLEEIKWLWTQTQSM